MRRCQEDLAPAPEHPGCIYGEMGMCLRPCQQVVGPEEYSHEVDRVEQFLRSDGRSLVESIGKARDRLSQEMMFEDAARQHKRLEKIQEVLKLRDELVRDIDRSTASRSRHRGTERSGTMVFAGGHWLEPQRFSFEIAEGKPVSLDRRLRELLASWTDGDGVVCTVRERQEYLALVARWYYSSWREGEWLFFDRFEDLPYRKLVHAISRVAKG